MLIQTAATYIAVHIDCKNNKNASFIYCFTRELVPIELHLCCWFFLIKKNKYACKSIALTIWLTMQMVLNRFLFFMLLKLLVV